MGHSSSSCKVTPRPQWSRKVRASSRSSRSREHTCCTTPLIVGHADVDGDSVTYSNNEVRDLLCDAIAVVRQMCRHVGNKVLLVCKGHEYMVVSERRRIIDSSAEITRLAVQPV